MCRPVSWERVKSRVSQERESVTSRVKGRQESELMVDLSSPPPPRPPGALATGHPASGHTQASTHNTLQALTTTPSLRSTAAPSAGPLPRPRHPPRPSQSVHSQDYQLFSTHCVPGE